MFQKIKIILKKPSKKNFLILLLILAGLFFVAAPSYAFVFDPALSAMAGLAKLGGEIFAIFIGFIIALVFSYWFVSLSAHLLEWAMALPINLMGNELVNTGWTFIRDLVNLFFALALVAIAMAFVLKIENFEIKKSLPNLIIIALLVNFSLLLVGAFIDIASILQNTILGIGGGRIEIEGLVVNTIGGLKEAFDAIKGAILSIIITWVFAAAIPYLDIGKFIAQAALLPFFIGNFFHWFLVIAINVLIGLILSLFFFLFLIRIIALWILAIFAPLAFLAFILPVTKKYFHLWLKAVVGWAFLGIIALFLLTLGLRLLHITVIPDPEMIGIILPFGLDPGFVVYYFFLLTFLIIAFVVSLKTAPAGADMAIKTAQSAIGGIAKVGIGTAIGHKLAGIEGWAGKKAGDLGEKGTEHGAKLEAVKEGGIKGWASRWKGRAEQVISRPLARAGYGMQQHAEKQSVEEQEGIEKKYKGLSTEQLTHAIKNETNEKELAVLSAIAAKDPGHAAGINEVLNEGKGLREQRVDAEKWERLGAKDQQGAEKEIDDGRSLTEQRATYERIQKDGTQGATKQEISDWSAWHTTSKDPSQLSNAEAVIEKGEGLEKQRDNAGAWNAKKDPERKEAEEKIAKADVLTKKIETGYNRNLQPDRIDLGYHKDMQSAFAVPLENFEGSKLYNKLSPEAKEEAKVNPGKIMKRAIADPSGRGAVMDIPAMIKSKKIGVETEKQILKFDGNTLKNFEKTPFLLSQMLTVLRQKFKDPISKGGCGGSMAEFRKVANPDAADYVKQTAGIGFTEGGMREPKRIKRTPFEERNEEYEEGAY